MFTIGYKKLGDYTKFPKAKTYFLLQQQHASCVESSTTTRIIEIPLQHTIKI